MFINIGYTMYEPIRRELTHTHTYTHTGLYENLFYV